MLQKDMLHVTNRNKDNKLQKCLQMLESHFFWSAIKGWFCGW